MKVLFVKDLEGVGREGEIKEVSDGYGRNYLIPKGFAVLATPSEIKKFEEKKKAEERRREKERRKAEELARKIEGLLISLKLKVRGGQDIRLRNIRRCWEGFSREGL